MKTILLRLLVPAFVFVTMSLSGQKPSKLTKKDSTKFLRSYKVVRSDTSLHGLIDPGEIAPAEAPYRVHRAVGEETVEISPSKIKLNGVAISIPAGEISSAQLAVFRDSAKAIPRDAGACGDWMPGMRIIYGQDGSFLVLYFQPVQLCAYSGKFLSPKGQQQHFDLTNSGGFYTYIGGQFVKLSPAQIVDMNTKIDQYRKKKSAGSPYGVEILSPNNVWGEFVDNGDNDAKGNVKSLVYPVDELITLANISGAKVKLWNAVETAEVTDGNTTYHTKHDILLSTGDVYNNGNDLIVPVNAAFANLSHICPPSCNGRVFTMYVK
jgi:hypothetical protein